MKLISLNIWTGALYDPLMDFLGKTMTSTDIFCFQEVFDNPSEAELSTNPIKNSVNDIYGKLCKKLEGFQPLLGGPSTSFSQRTAIFTSPRIKLTGNGDMLLCDQVPRDFAGKKFTAGSRLLWTSFSDGNREFTVANIHGFWTPSDKKDTPERIHQSEKINKIFSERNGQKKICGDRNLDPDTESIKILDKVFRDLIKENNIKSTRSNYTPQHMTKFADYMFVSGGIQVRDFKVLDDVVSDHLPLSLEFS